MAEEKAGTHLKDDLISSTSCLEVTAKD